MTGRTAINDVTVLRIEAKAILRSVRSDPPDQDYERALVALNGYSDGLLATVAAIMNEIASTSGSERFPMALDDVLNALKFMDLLTAFDLEVKHMGIYVEDDDEAQEEPNNQRSGGHGSAI